jgi:hypothetical protein
MSAAPSSKIPYPSHTLTFESDATKKLFGIACMFNNEPSAVHPDRELLDFAEDRPANPFATQLPRHDESVDAQRIAGHLERDDSDDIAEELTEQSPCRNGVWQRRIGDALAGGNRRPIRSTGRGQRLDSGRRTCVARQEGGNALGVGGLNGSYEETESAHARFP